MVGRRIVYACAAYGSLLACASAPPKQRVAPASTSARAADASLPAPSAPVLAASTATYTQYASSDLHDLISVERDGPRGRVHFLLDESGGMLSGISTGTVNVMFHDDGSFEGEGEGSKVSARRAGNKLLVKITQQYPAGPSSTSFQAVENTRHQDAVVFGAPNLRITWKQKAGKVTAVLRRPRQPARTFEGVVDVHGVFALVQRTEHGDVVARLDGELLGLARLTTPDGTELLALDGDRSAYPDTITLGGVSIEPAEKWDGTATCMTDDTVFPQVRGGPNETALNDALRAWFVPKATQATPPVTGFWCGKVWQTVAYSVLAQGADWVSLENTGYAYQAGAHGAGWSSCRVMSLPDGKLVSLASQLSAASRKTLERAVRAALPLDKPGADVTSLGFSKSNDIGITADRTMCVVMDHGALALQVRYADEDSVGYFHPLGDPRPTVAAAQLHGLFPAGSLGARIFP